jgi:cellulose synthase/poly-beta-1,6-N-acetylglucosamine synthase-like glycosyltransferase
VRAEGIQIEHLHREDRVGYKAGALAVGLQHSEAEFVAVFDADFAPEPRFLARLLIDDAPFDDPKVAFVQARWAWGAAETGGWLPSVLALLLDRHFQIQKPVRAWIGNVTTFNGSGGVWRRAAIDDAGGWTADTLTEDLDLSYRTALAGWKGRYRHDVKVFNELPGHMRAFKLQQRRWSKGNAQCFRKLTRRVMSAGDVVEDKWDEAFMLAGYAIHPLLLASLLLWPWAVIHVNRGLFWVLQGMMSLGIVAAVLSFLLTIREREPEWRSGALFEVFMGVLVGMGLMVNNTVGQIQGFLSNGGEFVRTPKLATLHQDEALSELGADRASDTNVLKAEITSGPSAVSRFISTRQGCS